MKQLYDDETVTARNARWRVQKSGTNILRIKLE